MRGRELSPFPPLPTPSPRSGCGAPSGALGPRAEAAFTARKRAQRLLSRARANRLGVAALVRGILEPARRPTAASWQWRPHWVGDGGSGSIAFCYTWIRLLGWVVEPLYIGVVILEQVRTAVNSKTLSVLV